MWCRTATIAVSIVAVHVVVGVGPSWAKIVVHHSRNWSGWRRRSNTIIHPRRRSYTTIYSSRPNAIVHPRTSIATILPFLTQTVIESRTWKFTLHLRALHWRSSVHGIAVRSGRIRVQWQVGTRFLGLSETTLDTIQNSTLHAIEERVRRLHLLRVRLALLILQILIAV